MGQFEKFGININTNIITGVDGDGDRSLTDRSEKNLVAFHYPLANQW